MYYHWVKTYKIEFRLLLQLLQITIELENWGEKKPLICKITTKNIKKNLSTTYIWMYLPLSGTKFADFYV